MTINDVVNKNGSLNYATIGGFKDRLDGHDSSLADKANQLNGVNNIKQYSVVGDGVVGDSDSLQAMIDSCRTDSISKVLAKQYTIEIPSGKYIIDKQVTMSPYIKLKSLGYVNFVITFNGTAFWITPNASDPKYGSSDSLGLQKNTWNRGKYFDGSNGAFVFTTTLDNTSTGNNTIAIELGDRSASSDARTPVSRYVMDNVNVFGLGTAFKLNAINNYIGTFKHCHIELNNHAFWILSPTPGVQTNSGENFVFNNCIIAGQKQEAVLINSPGHDLSFKHCSFDFNASPVIKSLNAGTSIRISDCYCEKIGDGVGDQLFYHSESSLSGETGGRNTFYAKNFIMYLKRPALMFKNVANSGGGFINVYNDLDGLELRYQDTDITDSYAILNSYLVDNTQKIFMLHHRVLNVSIVKSLASKDVNLLSNGDFALSTVGTDLTVNASDPNWYVSFKSNISNPTIVAEGIGGSNCVKYTVTTVGNNNFKLQNNFMYAAEAGDLIRFNCMLKLDKAISTDQVTYRLECYDKNNVLISTLNYFDSTTTSSTLLTTDNTQFRRNRGFGTFFLPAGTAQIKPYVILGNLSATTVWVDDIHLSKSR